MYDAYNEIWIQAPIISQMSSWLCNELCYTFPGYYQQDYLR